jgi:ribosome biogenesis protein SSF1/2
MVISRGSIDNDVKRLMQDMRRVMEPFTATSLKVSKKNGLKDFISIAGPLHVTHLLMFTKTNVGEYLKIIRMPRGPTIHFKIDEFSLTTDVLSLQKKKQTHQKQYLHQPLLILNGFNAKGPTPAEKSNDNINKIELHHKLLATTLQNMFTSINVTNVDLSNIRRCVLFSYNKDDNTIDFRQ